MTLRRTDRPERPPLTTELVAGYMRARGDTGTPVGIMAGVRESALRPSKVRRPRPLSFAVTVTMTVIVALAVLAIATSPAGRSPTRPATGTSTGPARALLLATYRETVDGNDVLLRPADPATASPLEGFEPIIIRQPFEPHLSPDGRTLAIMTWLSDAPGTGTLRLIDLEAWTISETPVADLVDFLGVSWTPDSKALVWLAPTQRSDTLPVGRAFEVMRWTIGARAPEHLVSLPDPALRPLEARILVDPSHARASTLVVLGRLTEPSGAVNGASHVLTVDLDHPGVVGDVELPGLDRGDTIPAVVWDLQRRRLLLASHDGLVTVALPRLEVTTLPFGPGAGSADATPGTFLTGALGPDGERLYLTGLTQTLTGDPGHAVRYEPMGLRVIDTRDGSPVVPLDPTVGQALMSPSGDRLLVASWEPEEGASGDVAHGEVRVLDPLTLDELARILSPAGAVGPYDMSASWDGRFAYLVANVRDDGGGHVELHVVELADGRVVSRPQPDAAEPTVSLLALGGS